MGTRYNRLSEAVLTCTHNLCFEQKYEKSKKLSPKIVIFTAVKNHYMLHGRVFVMNDIDRNSVKQSEPKFCPQNQH